MHAIITGALPEMRYSLNGHQYTHGYWLADGIYPAYSWIVKLFPHPTPGAEEYFDVQHSAVRKDIERAFGVLVKRWRVLLGVRKWYREELTEMFTALAILHNMILQDDRMEKGIAVELDDDEAAGGPLVQVLTRVVPDASHASKLQALAHLVDPQAHQQLRQDIVAEQHGIRAALG
jgi:hypothetical protein